MANRGGLAMAGIRNTTRSFLQFYHTHPEEAQIMLSGEVFNLCVWDSIFYWIYNAHPIDSQKIPPHHKTGSTDPRWDTLLREERGLQANALALRILRKETLRTEAQKAA